MKFSVSDQIGFEFVYVSVIKILEFVLITV